MRLDARRVLLLVLGLALVVLAVTWAGAGRVQHALVLAGPFVPILLLCEGARLPLESLATHALLGSAARRVPLGALLRAQAVFYAVATVVPGGRVVGEVSKAALLAPHAGKLRVVAVAGASQANSLLADACVGIAALVFALLRFGLSPITFTLLGFAAVCTGLFLLIVLGVKSTLPDLMMRRFPRFLRAAGEYRRAVRAQRMIVPTAALALILARVFQIALFTTILRAVGAPFSPALGAMTLAVTMMASAAGDAIPGQVGPTDAALAVAGPALGVAAASMVSASVVFHAVQLAWAAALGTIGLLLAKRSRAASRAEGAMAAPPAPATPGGPAGLAGASDRS